MLKVANLTKSYGDFNALDDISFEVPKGQICAFLGVNGAGKTTTFRILAGLSKPDSGSIDYCGASPSDSAQIDIRQSYKHKVGYISDKYCQFENLTAYEHLETCAEFAKEATSAIRNLIATALESFELVPHKDKVITKLSHGMRQRLSLACTMMRKPELLIIDEPLTGLDPYGSALLIARLKDFANDGGTVLFSSHLMNIVEKLAQRVILLHNGQVELDTPLTDLHARLDQHPRNFKEFFCDLSHAP